MTIKYTISVINVVSAIRFWVQKMRISTLNLRPIIKIGVEVIRFEIPTEHITRKPRAVSGLSDSMDRTIRYPVVLFLEHFMFADHTFLTGGKACFTTTTGHSRAR